MNATTHHNQVKESIINQMQEKLNHVIETIHAEGGMRLPEWLTMKQANTPRKEAQETSDFIHFRLSREEYLENITFAEADTSLTITVEGLPTMLYAIRQNWGNGTSKQPGKGFLNTDSKNIQKGLLEYRNQLLTDKKKRAIFIAEIETGAIEKTSPAYLCRKWLLNPNTIEGIHQHPIEPPKAIFTPYSQENPKPITHDREWIPASKASDCQLPPADPSPLLLDYSEKAIAVFNAPESLREAFTEAWGKYSKWLKHPVTKEVTPGWVFSKKRTQQIQTLLKAY